jgi:hypothetical protein
MTVAQALLVLAILAVVLVYVLIYRGPYSRPKYPQFGR